MSKTDITLFVNGVSKTAAIDPRTLLAEALRESFESLGTRIGCRTGDCGACTVMLDGLLIKSCLTLAIGAEGREVVTIEGCQSTPHTLLRDAFLNHNAFQCGFCTSGMLMVAADLIARNSHPTRAEIVAAIAGNLCRCTGYEDIVDAIEAAAMAISTSTEQDWVWP
jgi:aerobic-type carbon monoxide dehydrogenase small subunit (CoxS/CutS family)